MKPIWWEKTVEYKFVREYLCNEIIAPFDGTHELAGDAALKNELGWILIEFKKDEKCLETEKRKFKNWDQAEKLLSGRDQHHFLIYGALKPKLDFDADFVLCGCTYFSRKDLKIEELRSSAASLAVFKDYLADFISQKKTAESSSGGISPESYAQVMGVDGKGKVVQCSTLEEFNLEHSLNLRLGYTHTRKPNGPSLG
ncbi:hypothetical protein [Paludibacterium paludis]|uniref:Uncharacterized protein n=1 Tax=Paludibacterium paludis TaxID=1225769 RepID=A0A918NXB4_9NEIS|nr:hypothetical protein [Paludibacterium paludis]GGY03798.1 hypothetical protein GCM10011289_02670 [Paludibacterium paludis]